MNEQLRKQINSHFVIRLTDHNGKVMLVGGGQLHKHIGIELSEKLCKRALKEGVQVYTRKLRRGVKIEFHSK